VCVPVARDGSRAPDSFTLEVSLHPVSLLVHSDRRRDSRGVWLHGLLVAFLPAWRYLQHSTAQSIAEEHSMREDLDGERA
jgi:hypothetical protein